MTSFPSLRSLSLVVLLAVLLFVCAPALAQHDPTKSLTVVDEWESESSLGKGSAAISPNGILVAHMDHDPAPDFMVKNTKTGEDKWVQGDSSGLPIGPSVAFSPDGTRLAFATLSSYASAADSIKRPTPLDSQIYTMRLDGSDLMRLAPGEPSTATYCKANSSTRTDHMTEASECAVTISLWSDSPYSPDGDKLIVDAVTNPGQQDKYGRLNNEDNKSYISVVSTDALNQEPEKLAIDNAVHPNHAFWSSDGTAIFYRGYCGEGCGLKLYRLDLNAKQDTVIRSLRGALILGNVAGADAVFLADLTNQNSISVVNLDGKAAPSDLAKAAARIPYLDSEGRPLVDIQAAPAAKRLLLVYFAEAGGGQPPGRLHKHIQVVSYE